MAPSNKGVQKVKKGKVTKAQQWEAKRLASFLKDMERLYMGEERAHRTGLPTLFSDALGIANYLEVEYISFLGKTLYKVTEGIKKDVQAKAPAIFTAYLEACDAREEYYDEEYYPGDDAPGEMSPEKELSLFLGRMESLYNGTNKYQRRGLLDLLKSMLWVAKRLLKAYKEGPYYEEGPTSDANKKWIKKEMGDLEPELFTSYLKDCYPVDYAFGF